MHLGAELLVLTPEIVELVLDFGSLGAAALELQQQPLPLTTTQLLPHRGLAPERAQRRRRRQGRRAHGRGLELLMLALVLVLGRQLWRQH
jgi:hypothetical protein